MEDIAKADEILIAEGIFDAVALCQVRKVAVSAMSTNNWPEHFLAALRAELERIGRTVRPRLVFAFDVGRAGVEATIKYVKRATTEGWDASAMQVRPDGEGTKKDWNDLLKDHLDWAGDPDKAPLSRLGLRPVPLQRRHHHRRNRARQGAADGRPQDGRLHLRIPPQEPPVVMQGQLRRGDREAPHRGRGNRQLRVPPALSRVRRDRRRDQLLPPHRLPVRRPAGQGRFSSAACANSGEFKKA
jgi:hypothetical protein